MQQNIDFNKFMKKCEMQKMQKICGASYSKLNTAGNDPTITRADRYSNYVHNSKTITILNLPTINVYINDVSFSAIYASGATVSFTGLYDFARITIDNITHGVVKHNETSFMLTNLLPNKKYDVIVYPYDMSDNTLRQIPYSFVTLPQISKIKYGIITDHSIEIDYDGSFSFVTILNASNNSLIAPYVTDLSYVVTNIQSGSIYYFEIIPYNFLGLSGTIFITPKVYTYPFLLNVSYGIITPNSIELMIDGCYNYVTITRSDGYIIHNITTNDCIDYNVFPDISYGYHFVPYTSYNGSGNVLDLSNVYTLPIVYDVSFSNVTNNSAQLTISGIYTNVNIIRQDSQGNYHTNVLNYPGNVYTDYTLQTNLTYNYYITPFNHVNISGGTFRTQNIYTLGQITNIYFTDLSATSLVVDLCGSYSLFNIARDGRILGIDQSGAYYRDVSNLLPNTQHNYAITIYNSDKSQSIEYDVSNVWTLPIIYSVTMDISAITTTSLQFTISGVYDHISILRINGKFLETSPSFYYDNTSNVYIDNYNMTPNTNYSYTIYPYNSNTPSQVGNRIITKYTSTSASITSARYGTSTVNSIQLLVDGCFNSYALIRTSDTDIVPFVEYRITQNNYYDVSGLYPDVCYNYVVIPYNGDDLSGIPFVIPYNKYTLGEINNFNYHTTTVNSIYLFFSGYYYFVNILRNDGTVFNNIFDSCYNDIHLSANTVYSYSIIPVNEEHMIGPYFKTDPHCTMSVIRDLVFLDVSTVSITISLHGSLSFFDVYRLDLSIYTRSAINIVDLPADLAEEDIIANATNVANGVIGDTFYDFSYNMVSNSPYSYIIVSYNQFFDLPGSYFYTTNYTFTLATLIKAEVLGIYTNVSSSLTGNNLNTYNFTYVNTSIVDISYSGNFTTVSIIRNRMVNHQYIYDVSYYGIDVDTFSDTLNLLPKTYYQYQITPYNVNNIPSLDVSNVQIINNVYTEPVIIYCNLLLQNNSITLSISGVYDQIQIARFSIDFYNTNNTSIVEDFVSYGFGQNSLTGSNSPSYDVSFINHVKIADISINTIINNASVVNDFYKNFNLIYDPILNISYYDITYSSSFAPPTFHNWFYYDASNTLNYVDLSIPFDNARVTYGIIPFSFDYMNNAPVIGPQYSTITVTFARNTSI
jgi:hypothetical protein